VLRLAAQPSHSCLGPGRGPEAARRSPRPRALALFTLVYKEKHARTVSGNPSGSRGTRLRMGPRAASVAAGVEGKHPRNRRGRWSFPRDPAPHRTGQSLGDGGRIRRRGRCPALT
jgi:hypothetical protein